MGKRGPQKTPTAILKMDGSPIAAAREPYEPKPQKGRPVPQIKLSDDEQRVFDQVCDKLESMGLLCVTDGEALARYASLLLRYDAAREFVAKHGEHYPVYAHNHQGEKRLKYLKRFHESRLLTELEPLIMRLEREFGLTPAARAGLQVDGAGRLQDDLEKKFFAG